MGENCIISLYNTNLNSTDRLFVKMLTFDKIDPTKLQPTKATSEIFPPQYKTQKKKFNWTFKKNRKHGEIGKIVKLSKESSNQKSLREKQIK